MSINRGSGSLFQTSRVLYVPTYFARISGATFTSAFPASEALPTQCLQHALGVFVADVLNDFGIRGHVRPHR